MNLLVMTNNFWVGGRETYLATYLDYLRNQGWRARLLASSVERGTPDVEGFDVVRETGRSEYGERWSGWLEAGADMIEADVPDLLWAHHFDLFPAWMISRLYGIPLLVTFHGPLVGANRPNDAMQALGAALCLHRGDGVSAVSKETAAGVNDLIGEEGSFVLPNAIRFAEKPFLKGPGSPRRFVLVTRPEKLGHIRAATKLFAEFAKRDPRATLTIGAAARPGARSERESAIARVMDALRLLGGRWSWNQGPSLLWVLPRVRVHGYAEDARALIRESDIALGMGRVVLEALGEFIPCVLVGYDRVCGPVSAETFEDYRRSNFSGRGQPERSLVDLRKEILRHCEKGNTPTPEQLSSVSVETLGPELIRAIDEVRASASFPEEDVALAGEAACWIRSGVGSPAMFARVCDRLSPAEIESLYRVSAG